jgi:acyl-CoA thioesterase-1
MGKKSTKMLIPQPYVAVTARFNALVRIFSVCAILLAAPQALAKPVKILAFGDSLTAGFGLEPGEDYPSRLEAALKKQGYAVTVVNAGLSGETTSGGWARADWVMQDRPDLVILELGANDGLRGLDPDETKRNLDSIITSIKAKGAKVLLAGMRAPPNLGDAYVTAFNNVFPALAKAHKVAFYPFFLDGVAADPALNQSDGIHPNAKGVGIIVERILPVVTKLLETLR